MCNAQKEQGKEFLTFGIFVVNQNLLQESSALKVENKNKVRARFFFALLPYISLFDLAMIVYLKVALLNSIKLLQK